MSVTKRFIALEFLGALVLLPAIYSGMDIILLPAYNLLILGLLIIDWKLTPSSNMFKVKRLGSDKLYFRAANKLEIELENTFHRAIFFELKDQIPDRHFHILSKDMEALVSPENPLTFSYEVRPLKRGSFTFPTVHIRYTGLLGLCVKYFEHNLPMEYKVYPNLKDLSAYRLFLQKNNRLSAGEKRIPIQALGREFESLRHYVDGDDYRFVNWLATARENKLLVNQYEAEKNQPVMILLDSGRAMSYSIGGYKKLDYSINAALILSDIVMQKGDVAGLMVFETDIKSYVNPGKGEAQRNLLMEHLYHVQDCKYTPNYREAFLQLCSRQKRRSLIFLFTDFQTIGEADELLSNISIISRYHVPIIVLMKNESIERISQTEDADFSELYEKASALDLLEERRTIIKTLRSRKIMCIESAPDDFALYAVNQYLALRH